MISRVDVDILKGRPSKTALGQAIRSNGCLHITAPCVKSTMPANTPKCTVTLATSAMIASAWHVMWAAQWQSNLFPDSFGSNDSKEEDERRCTSTLSMQVRLSGQSASRWGLANGDAATNLPDLVRNSLPM